MMWMCVDYHKLNSVSKADLPNTTHLIDQLGSTRYISTLDLTPGRYLKCKSPAKDSLYDTLWALQFHFHAIRATWSPRDFPIDGEHYAMRSEKLCCGLFR